jgi:uncharacterized protein YndB with AHSA1/START domain
MTETPLRMTFDLACSREHAFDVWTRRIASWWPTEHTVTGRADAEVVLDGRVGGQIYERTPDGGRHLWGEVTAWEPPEALAYRWHIGRAPAAATDVSIRFVAVAAGRTRLEIEHSGWERLGQTGDESRARNRTGWDALLPAYLRAIQEED